MAAATTEMYTLSLHDALPIWGASASAARCPASRTSSCRSWTSRREPRCRRPPSSSWLRSEEHTSELQSRQYLVCRLLLEKKDPEQVVETPVVTLAQPLLLRRR